MNLEKLMTNPIAWVVLSTCTIAALIFAIFTWIKGKKRRQIKCVSSTFEIVRGGVNSIKGFKLLYRESEIDNLTVSKLSIWNSGNVTLNFNDFAKSKPLIISCSENVSILDAKIIAHNEDSNAFKINIIDNKIIEIIFDYIDPNNGIVIQVLHTGHSNDLIIEAKIKDGEIVNNKKYSILFGAPKKTRNIIMVFLFFFTIMLISYNLYIFDVVPDLYWPFRQDKLEPFMKIGYIIIDILFARLFWLIFKERSVVPSELRIDNKYKNL